ncbi:hypothetical protein Tco_0791274 [Tanacetum coccineum]
MAEEVGVKMVEVASNVEGEEEEKLMDCVVDGGRSHSTKNRVEKRDGGVKNKSFNEIIGYSLSCGGELGSGLE